MIQRRMKLITGLMFGCLVALALFVNNFGIKAQEQSTKEAKVSLSAEQVITFIRTAVAAKPGNVLAVEAENEGGKTICEVEILTPDGKTYDVAVDVATNTVVEVEADDDDKDDGDTDQD